MQVILKNDFPSKGNDLMVGDVFIRKLNNKVYMMPEQAGVSQSMRPTGGYGVVNLQDGKIFTLDKTEKIRILDAKLVEV